jgi:uncharacterized protein YihD (DUF1040 family)
MRTEREHPVIPSIYPTDFPFELTPGQPTYEYYVERLVESHLELLSHITTSNGIAEHLRDLTSEYILLRLKAHEGKLNASDQMIQDVYNKVLDQFELYNSVSVQDVQKKYVEYLSEIEDKQIT